MISFFWKIPSWAHRVDFPFPTWLAFLLFMCRACWRAGCHILYGFLGRTEKNKKRELNHKDTWKKAKSLFRHESINLNFPLLFGYLKNITEALVGALSKKDVAPLLTSKKKKKQKGSIPHLVFDSLKIQSCRLTCSFPDDFNYADSSGFL